MLKNGPKRALSVRSRNVDAPVIYFMVSFVVAMVCFGLTVTAFQTLYWPYLNSDQLIPVEAKVIRSRIDSERICQEWIISFDFAYEYSWGGRKYESSQITFWDAKPETRGDSERIQSEYPQGKLLTCYVNSDRPSLAVLDRAYRRSYLLFLIPAGLCLVAGVSSCLIWIYRDRLSENRKPENRKQPVITLYSPGESDVVTQLKPASAKVAIVTTVFVLFCFINLLFTLGAPLLFVVLFDSLFLLLLGILFLQLFVACPRMFVSRAVTPLGETSVLSWYFRRGSADLTAFNIKLVGEEVAIFGSGTDAVIERKTFYKKMLFETSKLEKLHQGQVTLTIPGDSMHSFKSEHNQIRWFLKVWGRLPGFYHLKEEFEIQVSPQVNRANESSSNRR